MDRDDLGSRVLLDYALQYRAPGLEHLLAHGLDRPASLLGVGELLLGRREHAEAAHDDQVFDHPGPYPFGTASHAPGLEGHHLVSDGRLGFALPAPHERVGAPPRSSGGAPTAKAG